MCLQRFTPPNLQEVLASVSAPQLFVGQHKQKRKGFRSEAHRAATSPACHVTLAEQIPLEVEFLKCRSFCCPGRMDVIMWCDETTRGLRPAAPELHVALWPKVTVKSKVISKAKKQKKVNSLKLSSAHLQTVESHKNGLMDFCATPQKIYRRSGSSTRMKACWNRRQIVYFKEIKGVALWFGKYSH